MGTLQAPIQRSSFPLTSSYKPSLVTIIQPSRQIQQRFQNRLGVSAFTAFSPAQTQTESESESPQKPSNQDPSDLDPNSTESTSSGAHGIHAEVASQQTAFNPSNTVPEFELEEAR
ncbi:predicted protein [Histoplasma capsulatum G186AR]|uniref:Uncharacterized protein n=2 Tax=Ajellomyces capsulatus TaxID=5037 RepID=C0NWS7_AJECG|nr:uncharacterized protein HCBG_07607 [Histoplasma capsulatum G186AR]EEH04382.1 predicted protein [Histoplasma capsulatum G186AR]KAG5291341.1 hypothetical protein I7I52_08638 [Histoplasma capsulatum]QSS68644.1 hypothetical protein I7I50_08122 [Histoplasma capsulatum G186AR]